MYRITLANRVRTLAALGLLCAAPVAVQAELNLGAEQFVQAGGVDIVVPGYSVPSLVDWNNDDLPDLVIGEGSDTEIPRIRIYLNMGVAGAPAFPSEYVYAQADGSDLSEPGGFCLGLFPRVLDWDLDGRKDLLVGLAAGKVKIFLNVSTDADPQFDAGTELEVGAAGSKISIDVGKRATPVAVDWNKDGLRDLVIGALDGRLHMFMNSGTDAAPDYLEQTFAQDGGVDLDVATGRSSPVVMDLNDDGKKDVLTGDTEGQLLLYANTGSDAAPEFNGYELVTAAGVAIDLPDEPRSRPFVCDWNEDGLNDVLLGAGDGTVRLYMGECRYDITGDGQTDLSDLQLLLSAYGTATGDPGYIAEADFDESGLIDLADLQGLLSGYGCGAG